MSDLRILRDSYAEVKRLAFFREIVETCKEGHIYFFDLITSLEERVQRVKTFWQGYVREVKDDGGFIQFSRKHKVAINYLKIAHLLEWVKVYVTRLIITVYGDTLHQLPREENIFRLSIHEKCLFLKRLLMTDLDCMIPLLGVIKNGHQDYGSIKEQYKDNLITFLYDKKEKSSSVYTRKKIDEVVTKVRSWKDRVLDHRVSPRLSWYIDLGLLEYDGEKYELLRTGELLFDEMRSLYFLDDGWFHNDFFNLLSKVYEENLGKRWAELGIKSRQWQELVHEDRTSIFMNLLEEGFSKFSEETLKRMSATSFLDYGCISTLVDRGIKGCTFKTLEGLLEDMSTKPRPLIYYYWSEYRGNGYIRKEI